MFHFGNALMRRTWRTVQACTNRRQYVVPPLVSARALQVRRVDGSKPSYQTSNSRFLSSVEETEESDGGPFDHIADDMTRVYKEVMDMLERNIANKEMLDIATKFYHDLGENNCGVGSALTILVTKALNYHVLNDGSLTNKQIKLLAIMEVILSTILLRDDMIDNAKTRLGLPTVHTLWNPYKVIVTGNMILAICFGEAAKLGPSVNASVCQMHEVTQKGQFLAVKKDSGADIVDNYLIRADFRVASLFRHSCIALARALDSRVSVEDTISRFGYHFGRALAFFDDIFDFEIDLKSGVATGPVIFAMREHPVLQEMILRKFGAGDDVEKALELVNNSQGFEETIILAKRHYNYAMGYLNLLADSPYRKAVETAFQMYMMSADSRKLARELDI